MDPFHTLGLEPCYDLDLVVAEQHHRDLSRALHPDRFVGRPASERRMALSRAIEVNEAWRVLRDPVRRGEALLRCHGIEIGETSGAKASDELLMEMMEHREALAEVRAERDARRLQEITLIMKDRETMVVQSLSQAFSHNPSAAPEMLAELRFVRRFLEEASAVEDELL